MTSSVRWSKFASIYAEDRRQAMYVWRNIETRSCNYCCCGKAISITYSECVFVDLSVQHSLLVRRITLSFVACPAVQYFRDYLIKGRIFEKRNIERKCVFWFSPQISSATVLIIRRVERDIMKNVYWSSCKVPFFGQILIKPELFRRFSEKKTQTPNTMKILRVGAELFHADWRTDRQMGMTNANGRFPQFWEKRLKAW